MKSQTALHSIAAAAAVLLSVAPGIGVTPAQARIPPVHMQPCFDFEQSYFTYWAPAGHQCLITEKYNTCFGYLGISAIDCDNIA
jgi:hypothetical protein